MSLNKLQKDLEVEQCYTSFEQHEKLAKIEKVLMHIDQHYRPLEEAGMLPKTAIEDLCRQCREQIFNTINHD